MENYSEIKGAVELIEKYKQPYEIIISSINELEEKKEKLKNQLDDSIDRFTVKSIEKNSKTKRDLNLIDQYLKEAYNQKENMLKESKAKAESELISILKNHKNEIFYSQNDINKKIAELIYEARGLYKEFLKREQEENKKINDLIEAVVPYLDDEDTYRKNNGGQDALSKVRLAVLGGGGRLMHIIPEKSYRVQGLLKGDAPIKEFNLPETSVLNELYGVETK